MGKSREFNKITIGGKAFVFNSAAFNELINIKSKTEKITKTKIQEDLADKTFSDSETVRKWKKGDNGPSGGVNTIDIISEYFNVERKDLLKPVEIKPINFVPPSDDEEGVIIYFHGLLSDFIYTYLSPAQADSEHFYSYAVRRRTEDESKIEAWIRINEEVRDYIYNLYKLLEKMSLNISQDTYDKLHRFISECKTLYELTLGESHMADWPWINDRWAKVNPRLELIIEYCEGETSEDELEAGKYDELFRYYAEDSGVARFSSYGEIEEILPEYERYDTGEIDGVIPPDYEAIPMEFARTLTLLFKEEFKSILS